MRSFSPPSSVENDEPLPTPRAARRANVLQTDVRKLLAVTQGKEKTYAGTSNDTEQGRAFLKKQLDGLMAEKAQYKEKKLALQQLKEQLPDLHENAEYHEPPGKGVSHPLVCHPRPFFWKSWCSPKKVYASSSCASGSAPSS